ncbi:DASH family cryptochrome [Chitinimonas sp. BJYL2]|uniref:DASH family cryptochrome n=1 Tax=Chitinimonas sp. BJYL2 TaxID=2976696 RepID=UPI0022B443DC|nr:DASH family cryptochrome [Chitinimonas sp. BJYL2]
MTRRIWWVRRDARLHDQHCLADAADLSALLPVVVLDDTAIQPVSIDGVNLGFTRRSVRAQQFVLSGWQALRSALRARGSDLLVLRGQPAVCLAELAKVWRADELVCSEAQGTEEAAQAQALASALAARGVAFKSIWQHTLLAPSQLPFRLDDLPRVFTVFRQALDRQGWAAVPPLPAPSCLPLCDLHPVPGQVSLPHPVELDTDVRSVFPFAAGESAALQRMTDYLFGSQAVRHYKDSRNGFMGTDYSSKFSPWLAQGQLSPRTLLAAIETHMAQAGRHESAEWLVFELLWRDFFAWSAARHGRRLFTVTGMQGQTRNWRHDLSDFAHWCQGQTGDALVDAGQLELITTGYIGNRARQNMASYLIHDLGIDWRWGAAWFEHHLLDYDPASNYGNWQYLAGVGNDPRAVRRFDTRAQARRYDPEAAYRQTWLCHE